MYLFFDVETSDLPRSWRAPVADVDNWPRIVQFAWIVCDAAGKTLSEETRLIKPEGFTIAPGAFEKHRISTERALAEGEPLLPVLDRFVGDAQGCQVLVAHNVAFDAAVVGAELLRAGMDNLVERKETRCTMKESSRYCRLPSKSGRGFKWPQLGELYFVLFGTELADAHDAAADCRACMECYFKLRELGVMA